MPSVDCKRPPPAAGFVGDDRHSFRTYGQTFRLSMLFLRQPRHRNDVPVQFDFCERALPAREQIEMRSVARDLDAGRVEVRSFERRGERLLRNGERRRFVDRTSFRRPREDCDAVFQFCLTRGLTAAQQYGAARVVCQPFDLAASAATGVDAFVQYVRVVVPQGRDTERRRS